MIFCRILSVCGLLLMGLTYGNVAVHAQCTKPPEYPNMALTDESSKLTEFPLGTSVTYQCSVGYKRTQGSPLSTCTGGAWSNLELKCEKISCGSPPEVPNGKYNISEGVEYGAVIVVTCNKGYVLANQVRQRNCTENGWSNRDPVCEVVKCPAPPTISNGQADVDLDETINYGRTVHYTCEPGYSLIGNSEIVCTENGTFQPPAPECKNVNCPNPVVENGLRTGGGPPPYGYKAFVAYSCNQGYELKGSAKITCEVNGWSPPPPTCERQVTDSTGPPTTPSTTSTTTNTPNTTTIPGNQTNVVTTVMTKFTTKGPNGKAPGMTSHGLGLIPGLLLLIVLHLLF